MGAVASLCGGNTAVDASRHAAQAPKEEKPAARDTARRTDGDGSTARDQEKHSEATLKDEISSSGNAASSSAPPSLTNSKTLSREERPSVGTETTTSSNLGSLASELIAAVEASKSDVGTSVSALQSGTSSTARKPSVRRANSESLIRRHMTPRHSLTGEHPAVKLEDEGKMTFMGVTSTTAAAPQTTKRESPRESLVSEPDRSNLDEEAKRTFMGVSHPTESLMRIASSQMSIASKHPSQTSLHDGTATGAKGSSQTDVRAANVNKYVRSAPMPASRPWVDHTKQSFSNVELPASAAGHHVTGAIPEHGGGSRLSRSQSRPQSPERSMQPLQRRPSSAKASSSSSFQKAVSENSIISLELKDLAHGKRTGEGGSPKNAPRRESALSEKSEGHSPKEPRRESRATNGGKRPSETPLRRQSSSASAMGRRALSESLHSEDVIAGIDDKVMLEFTRRLSANMNKHVFPRGAIIIRKGNLDTEMYFVKTGTVQIISADETQVFDEVHAGSFFGELAVFHSVPRTATVRALTNCYCTSLSKEHLESVLKQFPDIAKKFSVIASRRFQQYLERNDPIQMAAPPQLPQRSRNGSLTQDTSQAQSPIPGGEGSAADGGKESRTPPS